PEGWNLETLDSVVNVLNGYSYKGSELQESEVAMVTLKNFNRNGGFRFDGFKEIISENYKDKHVVKVGDLIVAHTDLTQDAEVLGNPAIIMKNDKYRELIISMDLVKVESKNEQVSTEFLYFLMTDKRFKSHCKGYSNGTTVLHLSKNAIPEYQFPWPNNMSIVSEFGLHAKKTYSKIQNNISEIQNLTELRDTLLPKLMSGELTINEL
ncbi:MAG: restriction endonuclease subunit S, partial [Fluviicola sp.]|nr:restriction endonuclease subunit S [Fluviicola sp.]